MYRIISHKNILQNIRYKEEITKITVISKSLTFYRKLNEVMETLYNTNNKFNLIDIYCQC